MKTIAFYDTKPYDEYYFNKYNKNYNIKYFDIKLNTDTAILASGCEVVVAFVNDKIDAETIKVLDKVGVKLIAMRCAGYNNVDVKAAWGRIHLVRVPSYSPYAVAEHAMALLLALNRKIHKAYNRVRDFNFSLNGLTGFDMHGKTIGVIGTGRIGKIFINIARGFGMNVLAYDVFPAKDSDYNYVTLDELYRESDIISLHVPLTEESQYMINSESISKMKDGVILINVSRGGLVNSADLIEGLKSGKIGAAGLDVYDEEDNLFFEDLSTSIIKDDKFRILSSMHNVIVTSHQAFLTDEALTNIATTTLNNIDEFFNNGPLVNEICYMCKDKEKAISCRKNREERCF